MKTAISMPDDVFKQVDLTAKRLGISRSELFTRAVRRFLRAQRSAQVKASYDAAFGEDVAADTDEVVAAAARKALLDVEWDDS